MGDEATSGATVTVHFEGWSSNGTQSDSSRDRSQPFSFLLGAGLVSKFLLCEHFGKRALGIAAE